MVHQRVPLNRNYRSVICVDYALNFREKPHTTAGQLFDGIEHVQIAGITARWY